VVVVILFDLVDFGCISFFTGYFIAFSPLRFQTAGTSLKNATFGQLNSSNSPFGLKQEEFYAGTQGHFWLIA